MLKAWWGKQTTWAWWNGYSTTDYGDKNPPWFAKPVVSLDWPVAGGSALSLWGSATWEALVLNNPLVDNAVVAWLTDNIHNVLRIAYGAQIVSSGVALSLFSCGAAVLPGVGLIAVGLDQIVTGAYNIASPEGQSMSPIEYGGYQAALGLGASDGTAQIVGAFTPVALTVFFGVWGSWAGPSCFPAGTRLLTPTGDKPVEEFRPGDLLLSRSEFDPDGPVQARPVEEVFVRVAVVRDLRVDGQVIRTTEEHPFYVLGKGWVKAAFLEAGNLLVSHDGQVRAVEGLSDTRSVETVYNLRVAEYHTYFVGSPEWGFSVWAHNSYGSPFDTAVGGTTQSFVSFAARQFYTIENFIVTGSWRVARAAARLGIGLSNLRIVNGQANLGQIANATSFLPRDIAILRQYLLSRGATSATVQSGIVLLPRLRETLTALAARNKGFPGVLGSRVEVQNAILNTFRIIIDIL
jgi:hypothetical protein